MGVKRALIMHPDDNVATAIEEVYAGDEVEVPQTGKSPKIVKAIDTVPFGFKIALQDIPAGQVIRKYGEPIGTAGRPISRGGLVHVHNLEGTRARGDLERSGG